MCRVWRAGVAFQRSYASADLDADAIALPDGHCNARCILPHAGAFAYPLAAHGDTHAEPHADAYPDAHGNAHAESDAHVDAFSNGDMDTYPDVYARAFAHQYACAFADQYPCAVYRHASTSGYTDTRTAFLYPWTLSKSP